MLRVETREAPQVLEPRTLPNRWLIALAAVFMQLCLGSVYAWSVFVKPLTESEPWTLVQVSAAFTIAMASLGVGTVIGGLWQDRVGPRIVTTVAGILYGSGFLIAAWAVSHHQLLVLYAGYGLTSGFGMGMGYICPVATITKWFPDRRGLMTGAAVMGFGAGAVVMSQIAARMVTDPAHVPMTFETVRRGLSDRGGGLGAIHGESAARMASGRMDAADRGRKDRRRRFTTPSRRRCVPGDSGCCG